MAIKLTKIKFPHLYLSNYFHWSWVVIHLDLWAFDSIQRHFDVEGPGAWCDIC